MEEPVLTSLSLTHVRYDPSDPYSYISAWLALVPQALCIIYVTLIWATREVEVLLMFAGQMACEVLNFGLKRLIKEERPQQMHGKGYGMPSSHSQFVAFFSLSLTLFLLIRHHPHSPSPPPPPPPPPPPTTHRKQRQHQQHQHQQPSPSTLHLYPTYAQSSLLERLLLSALSLAGASAVAASRIYLNYHTPRQVLVGAGAGAVFAALWFGACTWARRVGLVALALDSAVARAVRLRDLIVSEDLQDAGWGRWEARRELMRREKDE